ncbi:O-antigen ligase family protein [Loktanella sp. DJP18]|uniref:O-antigen ligase family protein n=1 Tax=Loktanella sp. DJP18 TaxID=3409788 RepID=UPI003BB7DC78
MINLNRHDILIFLLGVMSMPLAWWGRSHLFSAWRSSPRATAFMALLTAIGIAASFGRDTSAALAAMVLLPFLSAGIAGMATYATVKSDKKLSLHFYWAFSLLTPLALAYPFFLESIRDVVEYKDLQNLLPGFGNIRHIDKINLVVACIMGAWIMTDCEDHSFGRYLRYPYLLTSMTMLFWGGSRGALISFIIAMIVVVVTTRRFKIKGVVKFISIFIASAISSTLFYRPHLAFGSIQRLIETDVETLDQISTGRVELWKDAFEFALQSPWVGYGPLQYVRFPLAFYHPHNQIIETLFSYGFALGSVMIVAFIALVWRAFRGLKDIDDETRLVLAPAVSIVTGLIVWSMFGSMYFAPLIMLLIAMALSIGLALRDTAEPAKVMSTPMRNKQ